MYLFTKIALKVSKLKNKSRFIKKQGNLKLQPLASGTRQMWNAASPSFMGGINFKLFDMLNGQIELGQNVRVFPISNWTELDVLCAFQ